MWIDTDKHKEVEKRKKWNRETERERVNVWKLQNVSNNKMGKMSFWFTSLITFSSSYGVMNKSVAAVLLEAKSLLPSWVLNKFSENFVMPLLYEN